MTQADKWFFEIDPHDATELQLPMKGIRAPHADGYDGIEFCPWPWEPIQVDAEHGQYLCPYCGSQVLAGQDHLDYDPAM